MVTSLSSYEMIRTNEHKSLNLEKERKYIPSFMFARTLTNPCIMSQTNIKKQEQFLLYVRPQWIPMFIEKRNESNSQKHNNQLFNILRIRKRDYLFFLWGIINKIKMHILFSCSWAWLNMKPKIENGK